MKRSALVSLCFLLLIGVLACLAPWVTRFSYETQDLNRILLGPNDLNWLGTDSLGRDLFSRIIYGGRVSLAVGVVTSILALVLGMAYGALAGIRGGWIDLVMMRVLDVLQGIPTLVLMILVAVFFDSFALVENGQVNKMLAILGALSLVSWVNVARLVRGLVLQARDLPFVEAARGVGASEFSVVWRHVIPNIFGPVLVLLTFQVPSNILSESFLSFIGLGLNPPYSSWGVLANEGWRSLRSYPHLIVFPGVVLFLTTLAFNLLGDGLRDRLDPKRKWVVR